MKLTSRFSILLPLCLFVALGLAPFPPARTATTQEQQKDRCEQAHPWQHQVDGKCVDKPGVIHHRGDHTPEQGEECWIECLCYQGQYPSGNSCAPCSYVGTVCIRH